MDPEPKVLRAGELALLMMDNARGEFGPACPFLAFNFHLEGLHRSNAFAEGPKAWIVLQEVKIMQARRTGMLTMSCCRILSPPSLMNTARFPKSHLSLSLPLCSILPPTLPSLIQQNPVKQDEQVKGLQTCLRALWRPVEIPTCQLCCQSPGSKARGGHMFRQAVSHPGTGEFRARVSQTLRVWGRLWIRQEGPPTPQVCHTGLPGYLGAQLLQQGAFPAAWNFVREILDRALHITFVIGESAF